MNLILLIDKPPGITSFDVIRKLRKKLGVRKMGHAGTLDPLATGLLIVAVGDKTKELSKYMNLGKEYEMLVEFGKISTTYDAHGEISESNAGRRAIGREDIERIMQNFIGEIQQTPPSFSAIRVNGRRAYEFARRGISVKLKPRAIVIKNIEILEWNFPFARLRVQCGKGAYMRSLAHDIGQALGCGAYVKELRRTKIGEFTPCVTFDAFDISCLPAGRDL